MLRSWKSSRQPARRVGILPGALNPVTTAHLELARQGVRQYGLGEVLFLLPQVLPHKEYTGAAFEQRVEMLEAALATEPQFAIGSTDQGLFIYIARECRPVYVPEAEFFFICGRDAAERVVNWDYGPGSRFADMLEEFQMLVAPREGAYSVPAEYAGRIHLLDVPPEVEVCSSSAVRDAIGAGGDWRHLVPPPVAAIIQREGLYAGRVSGVNQAQTP